ncbi:MULTISPECIES: methylenetetrahydrofolate reductase [Arthrobacter]|uniref:Methylenetetrahydrofolate reductase n=2 Tax=Arthrobacter TaxID=1663 RepID=A0ABU9KLJ9_9MICC|nr:methylenetetrahydrofolate reductase [Arthrobacter sp. YJM1]MDP5227779.1 methylenetetrahydrofolate reductase [Arthrobacter sp. YJM1]
MLPLHCEIIPTDRIVDAVLRHVPAPTGLSVTCLPQHSVDATVGTATRLAELGYSVVPHLAAKAIGGRTALRTLLDRCIASGISEVFVIGGDAGTPAGPYATGEELGRDVAELAGGDLAIGVAGYPEGHPGIDAAVLLESLRRKQEYASRVVTQMCFSADTVHAYVDTLRAEGVHLPVRAGVAGSVPKTKLLSLATKIGVGSSLKFLSGKGALARKLLSTERYEPLDLIGQLQERPGIDSVQLYSFNAVDRLPAVAAHRSRSVHPPV